jgi:hypothetical protein
MAAALCAAAGLAGCGGGPEPRGDGTPPVESGARQGPEVKHAGLVTIENEIQSALQAAPAGGPGGAQPNFNEVFAGAGKIARGADEIMADEPGSLGDEDRMRYEGFVAQLKQKAADLQAAAEQQQAFQARRAFSQLTASCVKCHNQFGAQTSR